MELSKNYLPGEVETKWYAHWIKNGYFHSTPNEKKAYTVVIPPPNVTGVLHMGHCLNNTIQDILVRRARMQGFNPCWVPGTDHASIATEAKVVAMLRERGISKSSLTRDEFLAYAWEWKEKYGGIILQQLRKMGCSLDWERTSFTMDPDYYETVIKVFVDLHKKGKIYRGKRMINWDVRAKTALSDEEVIHKEVNGKMYYIRYRLDVANEEYITIATVRPETIFGDTAICVHPEDARYKHLVGKFAFIPMTNKLIPIITDDYIEMDFGTGALKVTPAHDMNDFQLGQKHNLEVVDIMNDDGTISDASPMYVGEDRIDVRKLIIPDLEAAGNLVKIENYVHQVGFSERTDAIVEPRLSLQWWVDMKQLATPALEAVMSDEIKFHPAKFKNVYRHWMDNIKDWCISRQLWWGHRIPAWYDAEGHVYVETSLEKVYETYPETKGKNLHQDSDCLDTWFSSWLWPIEVFKGMSNPGNEEINYYYPTSTLVTAPEIIFFWVARMIMAGEEYMGKIPFKDVYFTGIVRDKQGKKMSKSLGNSPDLLGLIDQFGADAVRFGIMIASPAGNDLLFDESTIEQGKNFNNKLWNATKLLKMWEARIEDTTVPEDAAFAMDWFQAKLSNTQNTVDELLKEFRLSEALKVIYSLIWDDYCSWYLEWIKPGFEQPMNKKVYENTIEFYDALLQLLHPFMPFITEEIHHALKTQTEDICVKLYAPKTIINEQVLKAGELLQNVISTLRDARNKNQIKPKDAIELFIQTAHNAPYQTIQNILAKQINAAAIQFTTTAIGSSIVVALEKDKFYLVADQAIDTVSLKENLLKDLAHQQGFLVSVDKKLGNEKFVQNAKPEVLAIEQKKKEDALARIQTIEESLAQLG
jgi:valyl-tRNA synthetase